MNFRMLLAAIAFVGMSAGSALAQNAFTTGNVNMRAGPGTQYPRVTTVPRGAAVDVYGCISGWSWCDTSWRGVRGWISGNYLQMTYNNRRVYVPEYGPRIGIPTITFQFGNYWDQWYRDRPWYGERNRWNNRHPDRWEDPRPSRPVPSRPSRPGFSEPSQPPHVDRPRPPRPGDMGNQRPPRPGMGEPSRPPHADRPRPPRPGDMDNQRPPRPDMGEPSRPPQADRPRPSRPDEAGNQGQTMPQRGEQGRQSPGDMHDGQRRGIQGGNCPGGRMAPNGACI